MKLAALVLLIAAALLVRWLRGTVRFERRPAYVERDRPYAFPPSPELDALYASQGYRRPVWQAN